MGIVLLVLGILLTADALAVMVMIGVDLGALLSFFIGILLILRGANYKKINKCRGGIRVFKWIFRIFIIYIAVASAFLTVFGMMNDVDYTEEYVVVLGNSIKNSQPQPLLLERLKTAAAYCEQNPNAKVIVSGGQGFGENTSEANVMYAYLTEMGVNAENIIKEENSHNTYENYTLSDELTGGALKNTSVVTVTNGFHMFRAKFYAKLYGIDTHTMSAKTKPYLAPVCYIRESAAVIKMLVYYLPFHKG